MSRRMSKGSHYLTRILDKETIPRLLWDRHVEGRGADRAAKWRKYDEPQFLTQNRWWRRISATFMVYKTQIDTLRISGRSLDAYETRAVAPNPFRVLPDLRGTNHQLLDGPPRRTCAKKNSEMESLRQ